MKEVDFIVKKTMNSKKNNMTFLYIMDFCKFLFESDATHKYQNAFNKVHCGHFPSLTFFFLAWICQLN